jgi:hypothetical protein
MLTFQSYERVVVRSMPATGKFSDSSFAAKLTKLTTDLETVLAVEEAGHPEIQLLNVAGSTVIVERIPKL